MIHIMFKRVQTWIIILSTLLTGTLLFTDLCYTMVLNEITGKMERESISFLENQQYLVFTIVTFALTIIAQFYHKYFHLQRRVCTICMLILFAFQAFIVYHFFMLKDVYSFTIFSLFPTITIIVLFIATRYIQRDETVDYINYLIANNKVKRKAKKVKKR